MAVETYFADRIGLMIQKVIEFLMNLTPGYWTMLIVLFIAAFIFFMFDNFKNFLVKPEY